MRRSFSRNISYNAAQLLTNQLLGLLIFYLLSNGLTKADFGELNWCLAVLLTVFNLLSFGIDQVLVKRLAAGQEAASSISLYCFHVGLTGLLFYSVLFLCHMLTPFFGQQHAFLLPLAAGKLLFFFSTPFKQLANGLERFNGLLYMSIGATVVKGIGLIWLSVNNRFTLPYVVAVFVLGDLAELLICLYMGKVILKTKIRIAHINRKKYSALVKESLPQLGVVVFAAALARFDWIFIGLFSSSTKLAEYSFVYKVFEMATLPLLVIAPLLVPFFTKLLTQNRLPAYADRLAVLLRLEIIMALLVSLVLNTIWVPVMDTLTNGKYGAVNQHTLFILSLSMPLLYLNNFLWSFHFSNGHLKMIFSIFAITFGVNLIGDLLLIPRYQNEGAAVAYLMAILTQSILYLIKTNGVIAVRWPSLAICAGCALASGIISSHMPTNYWTVLAVAVGSYLLFLFLTTQLQQRDWAYVKGTRNA